MPNSTSALAQTAAPIQKRSFLIDIVKDTADPTDPSTFLYVPIIDTVQNPSASGKGKIKAKPGETVRWRSELGAFAIVFEAKNKVDADSPFVGGALAIGSERRIRPSKTFWITDSFPLRNLQTPGTPEPFKYTFVLLKEDPPGTFVLLHEDPLLEIEDGGGGTGVGTQRTEP